VLLGTPAEEKDGGKILLLNGGAYEGMDVSVIHFKLFPETYFLVRFV
jgi:metal-dependent amidase/aminoacylase/carboxypeptidase family protein